MKIRIALLLLATFSFSNLFGQTDEQIISELQYDLFGFQQDTVFIKSSIYKTFFDYDSAHFESITGLQIPKAIISDWKNKTEKDGYLSLWDEKRLNHIDTLFFDNDTLIPKVHIFKCLSENEVTKRFEITRQRQSIYSISKILFDNSGENAIFHFMTIPWPGDFSSETILIKKIFGKWIIVMRFDFALT
jgi:hypothetical protein